MGFLGRTASLRWLAGLGIVVSLLKAPLIVAGYFEDAQYVYTHLGALGTFLNTGWGTLATGGLGLSIVAFAAYRALHDGRTGTLALPIPTPHAHDPLAQYVIGRAEKLDRIELEERQTLELKLADANRYAAQAIDVHKSSEGASANCVLVVDDTTVGMTAENVDLIQANVTGAATAIGESTARATALAGLRETLNDIQDSSHKSRWRYDTAVHAIKEISSFLSDSTLTPEEKNAKAEQALVTFYDQAIKDELPTQPDAPKPSEPDTEEPPSGESAS